MLNSFKKALNQIISETAETILMYSASVEDLEIMACFFTFHEIKELPNCRKYLEIDLPVSKQLHQYESQKVVISILL